MHVLDHVKYVVWTMLCEYVPIAYYLWLIAHIVLPLGSTWFSCKQLWERRIVVVSCNEYKYVHVLV